MSYLKKLSFNIFYEKPNLVARCMSFMPRTPKLLFMTFRFFWLMFYCKISCSQYFFTNDYMRSDLYKCSKVFQYEVLSLDGLVSQRYDGSSTPA